MKFLMLVTALMSLSITNAYALELKEKDLAPMSTPEFDALYLAATFTMPAAKVVYVEEVAVEFSDEWMQEFRTKTSQHYQQGIKEKYGRAMKKALIEQLEKSGWEVVDQKSARSLLLVPKIEKLYIYAPNEPGIRQVIVRNAGLAQLNFSFASPNGDVFMKIVDRRLTRDNVGSPIVANMASNYRYFKILMENWAKDSTHYLDSIKAIAVDQAAQNK